MKERQRYKNHYLLSKDKPVAAIKNRKEITTMINVNEYVKLQMSNTDFI